jgi:hypothetical protein
LQLIRTEEIDFNLQLSNIKHTKLSTWHSYEVSGMILLRDLKEAMQLDSSKDILCMFQFASATIFGEEYRLEVHDYAIFSTTRSKYPPQHCSEKPSVYVPPSK